MEKKLSKFCVGLAVILIIVLVLCSTSYRLSESKPQEKTDVVFTSSEDKEEVKQKAVREPVDESYLKEISVEDCSKETTEQNSQEEPIDENSPEKLIEETSYTDFELPNDAFIIEAFREDNGDQKVLALKDEFLQVWLNQTMVCQKQIPVPAKMSIGSDFDEIIGNPYISEDGELVLIQSYTTMEGKQKLDYTILTDNCSKIVPTLNYNAFVFQDNKGNYGLAFYGDKKGSVWYPYEGLGFCDKDDDFELPKPTIIWLNESTVEKFNFGTWGLTKSISAISVRLYVKSYGELVISCVWRLSEPVEADDSFFESLHEKFAPQEYEKRFFELNQTIKEYSLKS